MVFILGIALGVVALALRSISAIATIGALIAVAFGVAALFSASGVHIITLLIALAGYNVGMGGAIGVFLVLRGLRTA